MNIKEMHVEDRPRERLAKLGIDSLSNEEILAIILETGNKKLSAKELANYIIKEIDGINNFYNITYESLIKINGIGPAKASKIIAALELGRRASSINIDNVCLNNSKVIFDYYRNHFVGKKQEYFYVLYLDARKRLIKEKLLFVGTINQSLIHPRDIFKEAFNTSATSIICIHNHPAGTIIPSRADSETTMTIKSIGKVMGIQLDDHIIIGNNKYYSYFDDHKL